MATSEATVGQVPDIYGQVHPVETPELIEQKLKDFRHELDLIPPNKRVNAILADEKCPDIVNDDVFKLLFLRCEVFNADLAAKRYVKYWDKRVEIFGLDRAFLPLTLNYMTPEDIIAVEAGFSNMIVRDIKNDDDDRHILFANPANNTKKNYDAIHMVRIAWYMIHSVLYESIMTQKKGLIFIAFPKHAKLNQMDSKLDQMLIASIQSCLPMRLSAMHITHPPSIFKIIWPIVSLFMSKRTKQRVQIHMGSQEQVLNTLTNKYGMEKKYLPTDIGGDYIVNNKTYFEQRRKMEQST